MRVSSKVLVVGVLVAGAIALQGCLAMAVTGAAVKTTGAVVKGTAKGGMAVGSAIIPGESRKQREKRERREWEAEKRAREDRRR